MFIYIKKKQIKKEMLRENETIQDILYDPNFRYI